jgi:hypothetical protein
MANTTAKELIELTRFGPLGRTGYTVGVESMHYYMKPEFEQKIYNAMMEPIRTGEFVDLQIVDLDTGKPTEPRKNQLKYEPKLTQRAFPKILNQVDLYAIQDLFKALVKEYDNCQSEYLKAKIASNWLAYESLFIQEIDYKDFTYTPAYKGCSTGRMYEIGGIQGMSRDFKKAAWESTGAINYDIRSCQIASLLEFDGLKDSTRETLEGYVENPNAKYEYAGRVGIDVDLWKQSLLSLFNGAGIDKSIYEEILNWEFGTYRHMGREIHNKFVEVAKPFIEARKDWVNVIRGIVAKKILTKNGTTFTRNGTRYLKNKIGKITKDLNDMGYLSSFLLQGIEARFIFTLIDLSTKYGYQVLGNEHDGLVTLGEISKVAIEEAKELTGLNKLELINKGW